MAIPLPSPHPDRFRGAARATSLVMEAMKGKLDGTDHVVWTHDKDTSYTPSGLLYDGYLYFLKSNSAELTCIEAESGEAAVAQCMTHRPSLVISDWIMPGMSGIEFCKEFRALTSDSYGYFILLTSKSEKNEVAEGLDAGADDFLTKPVDGHELRARITAGERIIDMQRELTLKNRVISDTLEELQRLYDSLDNDLIANASVDGDPIGERLILHGRVTDENGRPVPRKGQQTIEFRLDQEVTTLG